MLRCDTARVKSYLGGIGLLPFILGLVYDELTRPDGLGLTASPVSMTGAGLSIVMLFTFAFLHWKATRRTVEGFRYELDRY